MSRYFCLLLALVASFSRDAAGFSSVPRRRPAATGIIARRDGGVAPLAAKKPGEMNNLPWASNNNNAKAHQVLRRSLAAAVSSAWVAVALVGGASQAEDELASKYGNGKMLDTSLVDQTCLMDKCSLQSKECLVDDPSCRKGLTCTAKCMGDNACITGCMARYGNSHLDNLLKCTIEDNPCIKVAILPGGADAPGSEPVSPLATVPNFSKNSLEGSWYKVMGFNPNYDCYACQKNTFSKSKGERDSLLVDVQFSMPRLLEDGSPPPTFNKADKVFISDEGTITGTRTVALNDYRTKEKMIFDSPHSLTEEITLGKDKDGNSKRYSRTAHSEGEMFGLKFWENWYVIGENDPSEAEEFKFVYYNGKTRQNTYDGAFVYSRTKSLSPENMKKVYKIAEGAGLNPEGFCNIKNGCFNDEPASQGRLKGLIASTKVSELLGVKPVFGEGSLLELNSGNPSDENSADRKWRYQLGDYFENPHRHFQLIDSLRTTIEWPKDVN